MREIKIKYEINDKSNIVAYIDGCDCALEQEQILDYLQLLEKRDLLKTLTLEDDIVQIKDMIERLEKRCGIKPH